MSDFDPSKEPKPTCCNGHDGPCEDAGDYAGSRRIGGQLHIPTRYFGHHKDIIKEIRRAGFEVRLVRLQTATEHEPSGDLGVAAVR